MSTAFFEMMYMSESGEIHCHSIERPPRSDIKPTRFFAHPILSIFQFYDLPILHFIARYDRQAQVCALHPHCCHIDRRTRSVFFFSALPLSLQYQFGRRVTRAPF